MITFDPDGTFHVRQRAADRQILHPLRTVYGSKRLVGRTYRAELAAELQEHFAYPLAEAEGQRFGARTDDGVISMDTIASRILEEVRSTAEAHLGVPVEAAVITVPAYFSEVQREAARRATRTSWSTGSSTSPPPPQWPTVTSRRRRLESPCGTSAVARSTSRWSI